MRSVVFINSDGKPKLAYPGFDFFVVYILFFVLIGGAIVSTWPMSWIVGGILSIPFSLYNYYMFKRRAKSRNFLKLEEPQVAQFKIFAELTQYFSLKKVPTIYVDRSNSSLQAQARGYIGRYIIVVSAGLFSEAGRYTLRSRTVLAHEFAHIAHGDVMLLNLLNIKYILFIGPPFFVLLQMINQTLSGVLILVTLSLIWVPFVIVSQVTKRGIRRREFYADAAAANYLPNSQGFSALLDMKQQLPYHPSKEERMAALNGEQKFASPGMFNIYVSWYLAFATFFTGASEAVYLKNMGFSDKIITVSVIMSLIGALLILLITFIGEIIKPRGKLKAKWSSSA